MSAVAYRISTEIDNFVVSGNGNDATSTVAMNGRIRISQFTTSVTEIDAKRRAWKVDDLQQQLLDIMEGIHARCVEHGRTSDGYIDYVKGANIAGFKKVADAMLAFGVV